MAFFDFLAGFGCSPAHIRRMNRSRRFIVRPFAEEIRGARLPDLGAHDGRGSYALAQAGAAEVIGIDARADLAAAYADFPESS